jgi:DNA-binding NtrC family response regulator
MEEIIACGGDAPPRPRILVVDDELDASEALRQVLEREGFDAASETSPRRALARIASEDFSMVVTDLHMDEMAGLELCARIGETRPSLPVVVVTGRGDMDMVVAALRLGARDFLVKPVDADALLSCTKHALDNDAARARHALPHDVADPSAELEDYGVLGKSLAIRRVHALIKDLSGSLASVLLQGETGTGKEVVARAIHAHSSVRHGPFVPVNCAAIPAELLESEFFGHTRGAFTDAKVARTGYLVEANGGTLLLDEIGELPLAMQPKLLRALQERKVRPVGAAAEVPFDCRLITATNRNLEREIAERRFREDLYYRIHVIAVAVPPLRARGDDILLLAEHFLRGFAKQRPLTLTAAAAEKLLAYHWPGNVRELENCMERSAALCGDGELNPADFPEKIRLARAAPHPTAAEPPPWDERLPEESGPVLHLAELGRSQILRALELYDGNKTQAAKRLGIDRRTLYRRLGLYEGDASSDPI